MAKEKIHVALKRLSPGAVAAATAAKAGKHKRNVASFDAAHDPAVIQPNRLKAALAKLLKDGGREAYAYEFQDKSGAPTMSQMSGVSASHLNHYRAEFMHHVVKVKQDVGSKRGPKFVWFATVAAATKARKGPADLADFE